LNIHSVKTKISVAYYIQKFFTFRNVIASICPIDSKALTVVLLLLNVYQVVVDKHILSVLGRLRPSPTGATDTAATDVARMATTDASKNDYDCFAVLLELLLKQYLYFYNSMQYFGGKNVKQTVLHFVVRILTFFLY
jgi:hypothetical protein